MDDTRRKLLATMMFGAGRLGLRALATGLPISFLARPLEARADGGQCVGIADPQSLILSASDSGDPINANVPGTYDFPDIVHAAHASMAPAKMSLGSNQYTGAQVWSTLPQWVLDRTCFFHHATSLTAHGNIRTVLRLRDAVEAREMLPSFVAQANAPCLGTIQPEPLSVGAGEIVTFRGRNLPNLPPTAVRDLLVSGSSPLERLANVRAQTLDEMHGLLKQQGTSAQKAYLDQLAISERQSHSLGGDLATVLAKIQTDGPADQVLAAAALAKMKVAPVVVINIPFGQDNHTDPGLLKFEVPQHEAGVAAISSLLESLKSLGVADAVTFAAYNTFGRTLKIEGLEGRNHHGVHHTTLLIGKHVNPGVIGGLVPLDDDYAAAPIDSNTGKASSSGDIGRDESLAAMGKTLGAACGLPAATLEKIKGGKVVRAALR